jgi:(p)ppGpp synthase/HD superfamily hydrolase
LGYNNIDKEDKTSAYLQAKSMELESALIKALSQSTPNRYKHIYSIYNKDMYVFLLMQ